jgi:hypothetical protein
MKERDRIVGDFENASVGETWPAFEFEFVYSGVDGSFANFGDGFSHGQG